MGTTNRAEELAKELSERLERLCEGLAISGDSPSKETILNYFNELNNYRQSEIDELTKVIDGYKSDSEELITTKELLLDLTISDKKVYDKQEQRIINLSEKLLISEKSEKFYKDRAKELSDILYLAESENAELTKEVERWRNKYEPSKYRKGEKKRKKKF